MRHNIFGVLRMENEARKTRKRKKIVKSEVVTFKVTTDMKEKIHEKADFENRTMGSFLVNLIDNYLKENPV